MSNLSGLSERTHQYKLRTFYRMEIGQPVQKLWPFEGPGNWPFLSQSP
jgi:hypothetical protein